MIKLKIMDFMVMTPNRDNPSLYLSELIGIQKKTLAVAEDNSKTFIKLLKKGQFSCIKENMLLIIVGINCMCSLIAVLY